MTANTAGRSGVDAGCDSTTWQPCSDLALSNLKTCIDSLRYIYSIRFGFPANAAGSIGRYPEGIYQGGNLWYLTTFAIAEQLYEALIVWKNQGFLTVTPTSLGFFQQFDTSLTTGTYHSSSFTFTSLTSAIQSFADDFVAIGAKYTSPPDGSLCKQFSRDSGTTLGATDLTWSYASALTVSATRVGRTSATWGTTGLSVSSACLTRNASTVSVQFNVNATTVWGENIYLTGSVSALKDWSTSNPILLSPASYPVWSTTVNLPANTVVQYKYIRIDNGRVTWESDPNNKFTTAASGIHTVNDVWR